jgi:SAM-dependent methyltransferase
MKLDIRTSAAQFYDYNPSFPKDIPFYQSLIPTQEATVLELGCGTGRVTLPLSYNVRYIHGVDLSPAMITICREKLARAGIPAAKACVETGDITDLNLGRKFDLIIAPFRVMQNLETDAQVDGLFQTIQRCLAPGGTCILNVFRPFLQPDDLRREWVASTEKLSWEVPVEGGRIACYDLRRGIDPEKLVLYPALIYRRFQGEEIKEEATLEIMMRCYYPAQFEKLILDHGFTIHQRWGGYSGETYSEGPELVIRFGESVDPGGASVPALDLGHS